ncbi:MAG: alpha/beta hydrolase [Melioribacteraceae bacterium]|nr:alpha/beta hydrolase [Melioribacteraceae bacterium]
MKTKQSVAFSILLTFFFLSFVTAQENAIKIEYKTIENIQYKTSADDNYINERCVLDLYYPSNKNDYATIVWFHGGGLTAGSKYIPHQLKEKGFAVVAVNYRLYPKIKCPVYIEDAASAVAWAFKNIKKYGGDKGKIFVSGHSAGGYLTSMVGLDAKWLEAENINSNNIAGLIPFSGHTITHFTVREERGIAGTQPVIDEFAPLYFVKKDAPPLVLITGDRNLEMLGRYEENAYMMRMMREAGHENTSIYELQGFDHGGMADPAFTILINHVNEIIEKKK